MQDLFNLSGKVAIVTGTSRGLGQYFARALAKAGADLVITSRELSRLTEFKQEIESLGRRALAVQLDQFIRMHVGVTQEATLLVRIIMIRMLILGPNMLI